MSWTDWPTYSDECRQDIAQLLQDGTRLTAYAANPTHGPGPTRDSWAWRLEQEAKQVHHVPYVIVCATGTIALTTLLRVLYPDETEIITTALTFSATVAAILTAGHIPIFADVQIEDGLLDPSSVNRVGRKVYQRPLDKAVLSVYLFGAVSPHPVFLADACQAVGVPPNSAHGVWSFNGRKNVPAGEGGAIFTEDCGVASRCRLALGHAENFQSAEVGGNGHMNEITACLAYHGMREVRQRNAHRTQMAKILNDKLRDLPVITPTLEHHALYMYPLVMEYGMEQVADRLAAQGVQCQRGYIQPPLHYYPAFKSLRRDALPNTESLSWDRLLLFPQVTSTATQLEMEELGDKIRRVLE